MEMRRLTRDEIRRSTSTSVEAASWHSNQTRASSPPSPTTFTFSTSS